MVKVYIPYIYTYIENYMALEWNISTINMIYVFTATFMNSSFMYNEIYLISSANSNTYFPLTNGLYILI